MQHSIEFDLAGITEFYSSDKLLPLLSQHHWLLIDESKKQKRLYLFREHNEELLVFKDKSFKKLYCRFDVATGMVILRKNDADISYRIIVCQEDLLVMANEEIGEQLILSKTSYLNRDTVEIGPVAMAAVRRLVLQLQNASANVMSPRPARKRRSAYSLYVEHKRKITAFTFVKKLLTTLGISLSLATIILFTLLHFVEQPKALEQILPYCLLGMAVCFSSLYPLSYKLRKLRSRKKLKPLAAAAAPC